ncbi:MAG: aryl-sulfate sulfotransferase [Candidatus Brocadiia bacterium]
MPDRPVGVTDHRPEKSFGGATLFCHSYEDPQAGEGGVAHMYLVDMEGRPVHEWTARTAVQLLELLPDGTLCYTTRDRSNIDAAGLYKLAPDSSVLWHYHCRIDHDFHLASDGRLTIHCLLDRMVPRLGTELRRNPYIVEIGPEKELAWEWHGEGHLDELADLVGLELPIDWPAREQREATQLRQWRPDLQEMDDAVFHQFTQHLIAQRTFDWAHNNTCEVLPHSPTAASDSRFRAGNILFSYRSLDIIGVIDRRSGEIVWAWGPGELDGQHQPTMLPSGHIMVFDNGTRRGWSRVIQLDPATGEITWEYHGEPKPSFYSPFISGAQLLPNGNVLVCSGGQRRVFEVTAEGEVVWDFWSPYGRPGTYGIYRATRYSDEAVQALLRG